MIEQPPLNVFDLKKYNPLEKLIATRSVRALDDAFRKCSTRPPIPESFHRDSPNGPGPTFVPVKSYNSQEFFDLKVEKLC
jgi:hypothetical protein